MPQPPNHKACSRSDDDAAYEKDLWNWIVGHEPFHDGILDCEQRIARAGERDTSKRIRQLIG
jgi:hypothetical protein